jgi:hypothetical protein
MTQLFASTSTSLESEDPRNHTNRNKIKSCGLYKYTVNWSSIFTNDSMKQAFVEHLIEEGQPNLIQLVLQIEMYEATEKENEKKKLKKFFEIVKNYLNNDATFKVNVSKEAKVKFFSNIQKQMLKKDVWVLKNPETVFNIIKDSILIKLQFDSFPRFVRKEGVRKIFALKQNDAKLFTPKENQKYFYSDEDFSLKIVTEMDIQFMEKISVDDFDWNLIYSNNKLNMNTFKMKKNPFHDVSFFQNVQIFKYESLLPFSLEDCVKALNTTSTVDSHLCEQKQETFLSAEDMNSNYSEYVKTPRGNATFELTFKFPNLQKMSKSFVSITSFEKDGDWIRLTKPVLPDFLESPDDWKKVYSKDTEKKKDSHHLYPYFSRFQLKKVSDDETHYSVIYSNFF